MFDRVFFHFLYAFVAIITVAFAVLLVAGYHQGQTPPNPVDNLAVPQ
jgi:hypothetical protein